MSNTGAGMQSSGPVVPGIFLGRADGQGGVYAGESSAQEYTGHD